MKLPQSKLTIVGIATGITVLLCCFCGVLVSIFNNDSPNVPVRPVITTSLQISTLPASTSATTPVETSSIESVFYENCDAVREAGVAPLYRGDPGYRSALDRDNNGVACE